MPAATHIDLVALHATPYPVVVIILDAAPVHVLPLLVEYAIVTLVLPLPTVPAEPTATQLSLPVLPHAIPYASPSKLFAIADGVHVIPSLEYAILFVVLLPTATNRFPFHAMPRPSEKTLWPNPTHVIPSLEYAILCAPLPTATNRFPFHAMPFPAVEKISFSRPVHLIPSYDHAIVCAVPLVVPLLPTATHLVPFHAAPRPSDVKISFPIPVHVLLSVEYAIVFVLLLPNANPTISGGDGDTLLKAIPFPINDVPEIPNPFHVLPSDELAILFSVPAPTAIQLVPFHDTPFTLVNILCEESVHVVPSLDHAILALPTATKLNPLHAMVVKLLVSSSHSQSFPSFDHAIVFVVPLPTATHLDIDGFHATP